MNIERDPNRKKKPSKSEDFIREITEFNSRAPEVTRKFSETQQNLLNTNPSPETTAAVNEYSKALVDAQKQLTTDNILRTMRTHPNFTDAHVTDVLKAQKNPKQVTKEEPSEKIFDLEESFATKGSVEVEADARINELVGLEKLQRERAEQAIDKFRDLVSDPEIRDAAAEMVQTVSSHAVTINNTEWVRAVKKHPYTTEHTLVEIFDEKNDPDTGKENT